MQGFFHQQYLDYATNWGVQLCMLSVGLCCWPGLRMTWDHLTPLPKEQWLTETAKRGNIPQTVAQQFTPILFRHVSNRLSHGADDGATCCCLDLQDLEDSCAQHPWGSWKQSANGRSNSWHLTWSYWGINSLVRSVLPMQQPGGQLRQPRPSAVFQAEAQSEDSQEAGQSRLEIQQELWTPAATLKRWRLVSKWLGGRAQMREWRWCADWRRVPQLTSAEAGAAEADEISKKGLLQWLLQQPGARSKRRSHGNSGFPRWKAESCSLEAAAAQVASWQDSPKREGGHWSVPNASDQAQPK